MIAATLSAFHTASATSVVSPTVFVDPAQNILTSANVGTLFQVNVTVANITAFVGAQFRLDWNATILGCTAMQENAFHAVTPSDSWSNINIIQSKINKTAGYAIYAVTYYDILTAATDGYAPINATTAEYPPDGKLVLATLTFNVTIVPGANLFYESNFTLSEVIMGDMVPNQIPTTDVSGYYKIYGPPETVNHNVALGSTNYVVTTVSNASVIQGSMIYVENWTITFNLTGVDGTTAYVNVTIPKNFIYLEHPVTDHWAVKVNASTVTPTVTENGTHVFLYFTASLSTKSVTIEGTVPEFPVLMAIPLLMAATLIAVGLRRRRHL
jgi:hypothetical protein